MKTTNAMQLKALIKNKAREIGVGFFLPVVTYIPIVIAALRSAKKKAAGNQ